MNDPDLWKFDAKCKTQSQLSSYSTRFQLRIKQEKNLATWIWKLDVSGYWADI